MLRAPPVFGDNDDDHQNSCGWSGFIGSNLDYDNNTKNKNKLVVKKLNHNASERDRRKRINHLYSSLRSLLPPASTDHKKKLSIPGTISKVLKYIPELQKQVEALLQNKHSVINNKKKNHQYDHDDLVSAEINYPMSRIWKPQHQTSDVDDAVEKAASSSSSSLLQVVSVSRVCDNEILVQISSSLSNSGATRSGGGGVTLAYSSVADSLVRLEQQGLLVLNASTFNSFQGQRGFYNLHLQVMHGSSSDEEVEVDLKRLREKLTLIITS